MLFSFASQEFTRFFLWLTIPPWLASFIFSFQYIKKRIWNFRIFFLLSFLCNILLFYSNNWFTFLTVYETLTLCSLPLIFHDRNKESISGGKWYFFFSLLSGVLIFGSVILQHLLPVGSSVYPFILRAIGFLIKCGAFPFHVWLPEAHPAAPSPASAVLSGSIIKIGLYGLLFQTHSIMIPPYLGSLLLWIAVVTMFYGVIWALFQSNIKKMLAFHSVSQMGYVLMGLALFWIFNESGALIGSLTHAMNHAYFKSALFIAAGVQYLSYHTLDMYAIKNFFLRYKLASILFLIAVLGISGFPFSNGYISKTILHESLIENPSLQYRIIESIFLLTAIGTLVSNTKWFYLSSMRNESFSGSIKKIKNQFYEWFPLLLLGLLILLPGFFPILYEKFLPYSILETSHGSVPVLEEMKPFHHAFMLSFSGFLYVFTAGVALLFIALRMHWFHHRLPKILDIKLWWLAWFHKILLPLFRWIQSFELLIVKFFSLCSYWLGGLLVWDISIEKQIAHFYQLCYRHPIRFYHLQSTFEKKFQENLFISINPSLKEKNKNPAAKWFEKSDNSLLIGYGRFYTAIQFLFTISHRLEQKDSQYYEKIISQYGKIWIKWLIGITILLILIFIIIVRRYFP